MKITWLGQAGLLFEHENLIVMIDPYLSDSVSALDERKHRRERIDKEIFKIDPDVIIFTHEHMDHYDEESVIPFLNKNNKIMTVLCPSSVWKRARVHSSEHNFVMFDIHTEWTEGNLRFRAVKAEHSDPFAIGVIIEDLNEKKKYYVTGDTLYNTDIFTDIDDDIEMLFLPINGVGNNMNAADAVRFAQRIAPRYAVPIHFGMFDSIDPEVFAFKNRIIPRIYEEIVPESENK